MKFAILFCVVAFTCAAQASPTDLSTVEKVEERGAMVDAAKEKLEQAKKMLDSIIQKTSNMLKETLNATKKLADNLMDTLNAGALKATEMVYNTLHKILDKFDNSVLELERYARSKGADVSECSKMTETVRQAIMATISNSSACIVQKIEAGKSLVDDITRISKEALAELNQIKEGGGVCLENINGIKAVVSATACLGKTTANASWTVTKKIPSVAWDLTKITTLMATLPPTLSYCMTKNSVVTIAQETTTVLGRVKECVMQKVKQSDVGTTIEKTPFVDNSVIGGH